MKTTDGDSDNRTHMTGINFLHHVLEMTALFIRLKMPRSGCVISQKSFNEICLAVIIFICMYCSCMAVHGFGSV
jgi:hypothetical protein